MASKVDLNFLHLWPPPPPPDYGLVMKTCSKNSIQPIPKHSVLNTLDYSPFSFTCNLKRQISSNNLKVGMYTDYTECSGNFLKHSQLHVHEREIYINYGYVYIKQLRINKFVLINSIKHQRYKIEKHWQFLVACTFNCKKGRNIRTTFSMAT